MTAEVIFQRNVRQNKYTNIQPKANLVYQRSGKPEIVFRNGLYRTSNREEISDILNSDLISKNIVKCITPMENVDKWLRGETPDKLTEELLSKVSEEGLIELAKVSNLNTRKHANKGAVIKSMLKGRPVNNSILFILEKFAVEEGVKDWLVISMDAGIIYRSGPWYKYRKGDKEDKTLDLSISKTESEAQAWVIDNLEDIEARLK